MINHDIKFLKDEDVAKLYLGGCDEVGRGCLAGPVVSACVVMPLSNDRIIDGINDSKKISAKKRDRLFNQIKENAISINYSFINNDVIDKINILEATKLSMKKAIEGISCEPGIILVDGNFEVKSKFKTKSIPQGDSKSYTIACASIVAKVLRDRYMIKLSSKHPEYFFEKNKGYGTKEHIQAIQNNGKSRMHRNSFLSRII